jgi:hypothetical protein
VDYMKKKVDDISKDDISKEHEEFEKLVRDVLEIHDKLLKIGFEEIADDVLEIHSKLLKINEQEAKQNIDKQIQKLENLKDKSIKRLKIEMRSKNVSDDLLTFLVELTAKNFDEQITALKKTVL